MAGKLVFTEHNLDNLAYAVRDAMKAEGIPHAEEIDATDLNMMLEEFFIRNDYTKVA